MFCSHSCSHFLSFHMSPFLVFGRDSCTYAQVILQYLRRRERKKVKRESEREWEKESIRKRTENMKMESGEVKRWKLKDNETKKESQKKGYRNIAPYCSKTLANTCDHFFSIKSIRSNSLSLYSTHFFPLFQYLLTFSISFIHINLFCVSLILSLYLSVFKFLSLSLLLFFPCSLFLSFLFPDFLLYFFLSFSHVLEDGWPLPLQSPTSTLQFRFLTNYFCPGCPNRSSSTSLITGFCFLTPIYRSLFSLV